MISPLKAFGLAVLVGAAGVLGTAWYQKAATRPAVATADAPAPKYAQLAPGVYVTSQIGPADVAFYRARAEVKAIVDLRPDGEVADQPSAEAVGAEARKQGMRFAYVPTPHGPIPDAVVAQFSEAMSKSSEPVLLYCRSGSRAARVWALAEASKPGGLDAPAILKAVRAAGLSAEGERADIEKRIAARSPQ